MNREKLRELGLSEDAVNAVMAEYGKSVEGIKAESAEREEKIKGLNAQIEEANKQIEAFKGLNVDQIKASADEYKIKYDKAVKESLEQINALRLSHAIENGLKDSGARNIKAVSALLDMSAVSIDKDGSVQGLSDQIEKIKAENDFLFKSQTVIGGFKPAAGGNEPRDDDPFLEGFKG